MKAGDEQKVQNNIDGRGQKQIVKRPTAVSERVHNALAGIIENDSQNACKIVPEIGDRVRQYLGIGSHPAQNVRRHADTEDGQNETTEDTQKNDRMDGALDPVWIVGTEIPGNCDARAERQSFKEADEQENERARGADGGKRRIAEKAADDERIGRIVELLKNLAEQNRQGKACNQPPETSFRHVPCRIGHNASILSSA